MAATTEDATKSRFYAGLYLRTNTRTRFWGWGKPEIEPAEWPWAALADWLRSMHSLAKSGAEAQALRPGTSVLAGQETGDASQPAKQRMRFVCTRHFVGLVLR
jgi:hypothetical protein